MKWLAATIWGRSDLYEGIIFMPAVLMSLDLLGMSSVEMFFF